MLRSICLAALLLFCSCGVFAADAIKPCVSSWECIGMVEIRVGETTYRMSRYSNNEILADIEAKSGRKRYLVAQPSGTEWYFGLSPEEISNPGMNPFAFFDYAFALPVAALRMAFPDGPSSIPESAVQRNVVVEANPVAIRASKLADGRIAFRLEIASAGAIVGQLSPALLPPLDGNYPIAEWKSKAPRVGSLKEARLAARR
jgi:hypothetical protein